MHVLFLFFSYTLTLYLLLIPCRIADAAIAIGNSKEEVIAELGEPDGELQEPTGPVLIYPHGFIECDTHDRVITIELEGHGTPETIMVFSQGGQEIDIQTMIVPGKITIIDFYATWCPPCKAIGPKLEQLARTKEDVYLRKINIESWGTPITLQYGITGIPYIYVFGRNGKPIGSPTSSYTQVQEYVNRAR